MNPDTYEEVTAGIANSVFVLADGASGVNVKFGNDNKWCGVSGYKHQIDVAIYNAKDIIFVECKYLRRRVNPEQLLAFIARMQDIKAIEKRNVHPVMVSKTGFQAGCKVLAKCYDIDLEIIESAGSFAFNYKGLSILGLEPKTATLTLVGHAPTVTQSAKPEVFVE